MVRKNLNLMLDWVLFQHQLQIHITNKQNLLIHCIKKSWIIKYMKLMVQQSLLIISM